MSRSSSIATALLAGLVSLAAPARAQTTSPAPDDARWSAAFSLDPFHLDLRTKDPGADGRLFLTLGRRLLGDASGFALRADLLLGTELPRGLRYDERYCRGTCDVTFQKQYAGLQLGGTYSWRLSRAVRPYLHAGTGLFVQRASDGVAESGCVGDAVQCPDPIWGPIAPQGTRAAASLGVSGAVGFDLGLGGRRFFVEHSLSALDGRRLDRVVLPLLTIGMRF